MSELLKNIDARTRLAGTNKLEILLFTLGVDARTGRRETFGINVFKVREVMRTADDHRRARHAGRGAGHGQPARRAGAGGRSRRAYVGVGADARARS